MNLQAEPTERIQGSVRGDSLAEKKSAGANCSSGSPDREFFAKLKFVLLPLVKFLPILLKSGGTMLLMVWVYTQMWGWQFALGFVLLLLVHETGHLLVAKKFGSKSARLFLFRSWVRLSR